MKRSGTIVAAMALIAAITLSACGDDDKDSVDAGASTTASTGATSDTSAAGELTITDAWARTSPMATSRGAAYMVITNGTATDDALLSASVDASIAKETQVHETTTDMTSETSMDAEETTTTMMGDTSESSMGNGEDPMMGMREIDELPIAAGESVTLAPGGYHIMLMDLVAPLEEGATFDVTLEFREAGTKTVSVEVRSSAP